MTTFVATLITGIFVLAIFLVIFAGVLMVVGVVATIALAFISSIFN